MPAGFIPDGRQPHVEALVEAYGALSERRVGGLQLVSLEASPGQGKTRIVQEFYEVIAENQSFWPKSLIPEDSPGADTRKYFALPRTVSAGGGDIPFLWLGIECARDSRGAESADVAQALRFVCGALPSVFESASWTLDDWLSEFRSQGKDVAIGAAMEAVGLTFESFVPAGGVIRLGGERLHGMLKRRRAARLEESARTIEADIGLDEEFSLAVANASRRRPDMPVILVIEDSHFATEQLCSTLLQLLRPDNKRKPSVLVVATGWPELLDDEGNVFGALMSELQASGVGVSRHLLEPFGVGQGAEIIRQRYPGTDAETAQMLSAHVGGNPHGVRLLLDLRDVRAWVVDDCIAIPRDELNELPSQLGSLYSTLWEELDEDVRDVLAVAALQEESPVESLTRFMAERLLIGPDGGVGQVGESLERAIDPYRWIRRLAEASDLMKFHETERYRLADQHNVRPHRLKAPKLIEEFVVSARSDEESWLATPTETRLRLLELHVSAGRADDSVNQHEAALSLFELGSEQRSRRERLKLLGESAAWARTAEREVPQGTIWSEFEIENSQSRRVPLSLRIVESMSSWHDGALALDERYAEFLHLVESDIGASAAAVELVAGVVPVNPEREPGPWIFNLVLDWIRMEPVDADELAWKRLVLLDVFHWWGGEDSERVVLEELQATLDDRATSPFMRSRTRRVFAARLLKEKLGRDQEAETILLGDLDEPDLDGRERSWARGWVAGWRAEAGDVRGAEGLLRDDLADPRTPLRHKAGALLSLSRILGSAQSLDSEVRKLQTQLDQARDLAPLDALHVRNSLARLLEDHRPEEAATLLTRSAADAALPPEVRADAHLDLARFHRKADPDESLRILSDLRALAESERWSCEFVARAISLKLEFEILTESTSDGDSLGLLDNILSDPDCPDAQRIWAVCELAERIAVSQPARVRELLQREAEDVSSPPAFRQRARQLLTSLKL